MAVHNLWGQLPEPSLVRTPKSILAEQAQLLADMTKHILVGEVTTSVIGDKIQNSLLIVAPFLNNYRVVIVNIQQGVEAYPVVYFDHVHGGPGKDCNNEDEFESALRETLQSDKVRRIIAGLLAQSKNSSVGPGIY